MIETAKTRVALLSKNKAVAPWTSTGFPWQGYALVAVISFLAVLDIYLVRTVFKKPKEPSAQPAVSQTRGANLAPP